MPFTQEHLNKKDIIFDIVKDKIISGEYPPGYRFSSEPVMAKQFGVGRDTLRSAFKSLEMSGLIIRVPGKGTFVKSFVNPKNILVIVSELEKFANTSIYILDGIKDAASKATHKITVSERSYIESMTSSELQESMKSKNICGIISLTSNFNGSEKIIKILQESKFPVVLPHAYPNDHEITGFATITVTEALGWQEAIKHLCDSGHQRIASIIHNSAPSIRGYTEKEHISCLNTFGADTSRDLIKYIPYKKENIKEAVYDLMKMPKPPTAILCYSDYFAIDTYGVLKELKLKIPDNVAVMGTCGFPGATFLSPPLSTSDYQYHMLGEKAVEVLVKSDEWFPENSATAVPQIYIDPVLKIRSSTKIKRIERRFENV